MFVNYSAAPHQPLFSPSPRPRRVAAWAREKTLLNHAKVVAKHRSTGASPVVAASRPDVHGLFRQITIRTTVVMCASSQIVRRHLLATVDGQKGGNVPAILYETIVHVGKHNVGPTGMIA